MSTAASDARWRRLAELGIVAGEPPPSREATTPWYVGALVGAAAWLAAVFLLFFLGLALEDVVKRPPGAIAVGIAVVVVSSAVLRFAPERRFFTQLALAFSLAGQAMLLAGLLMGDARPRPLTFGIFALVEAALVAVVPQPAHRVLATLGAAVATLLALEPLSLDGVFMPLLLAAFVVAEARVMAASRRDGLWTSIVHGLALALVAAFVYDALPDLFRESDAAGARQRLRIVATLALALVAAGAAAVVVRDGGGALRSRVGVSAALSLALVAVAAHPVPAVAASFTMLLLAYAAGQRALGALAIVALVASLGHHYYRLDMTLLQKSAGLAALGAVLLAAHFIVRRWPLPPKGDAGA